MPRLPFAGFTADVGTGVPGGQQGATPTAESFGAPVARATVGLARAGQQVASAIAQMQEEREARRVQVDSAKLAAGFTEELDQVTLSGGDFDPLLEKYTSAFDDIGEDLQTRSGSARLALSKARAEDMFGGAIRAAEAKRAGLEVRTQTQDLVNILGGAAVNSPDTLPAAVDEIGAFIDSFGNLRPEDKATLKQGAFNDVAMASANGMLLKDPLRLKLILTEGEGIPHITPGQKASLISKARAELERRGRAAKSKDEMAKLLTRQALAAEAESHVLTNPEAPEWFDRGVSAAQFDAAIEESKAFQAAREKLSRDIDTITNGGGSALSKTDYENALIKVTADATEGLPPEQAAAQIVNIRVASAAANGRQDAKLKALLNAGPSGGEETFAIGYDLRNRLREESPELLHKMMDGNTRTWYNAYDFMVGQLGISHDAARERLLEVGTDAKKMEQRLGSKDNRELIADAIDIDFPGQSALIQDQVTQRAAHYMALVPTMTAEQAVDLSAKDIEESTVVLTGGVRASIRGVPVDWEAADQFVRQSALKNALREAGFTVTPDELDDYMILPNGDGTAAVIAPNGLTVFPAWNWQGAVNTWRTEILPADVAVKSAREQKRAKEREAEAVRELERIEAGRERRLIQERA